MKIISILATAIIAFSSISQEIRLSRLTDLCEGSCRGVGALGSYTSSKCYFSGRTPTGAGGLFTTDGTIGGTFLIKQIDSVFREDGYTSISEGPVTSKGIFYFGSSRGGLWRSDGTEKGTFELRSKIWPQNIRELNGDIVFTSRDSIHGKELWKSDGTVEGTHLLKDIYPGVEDGLSIIDFNTVLNGRIYFSADDGEHGKECWFSDGTPEGTRMLEDLNQGSEDGYFQKPIVFNNEIYFNGNKGVVVNNQKVYTNGVFKTNGSTPILAMKDISMWSAAVFQNQLFFGGSFTNDNTANVGYELYKSTGSDVTLVKDIKNIDKVSNSFPSWLTVSNNKLYFTADDGIHGSEPWVSDGTTNGTFMIKDICPGKNCSTYSNFSPANNRVYFTGYDPLYGHEIFETDGTSEGTKVYDILPGSESLGMGIIVSQQAMNYNDELYIVASDGGRLPYPQPTYGFELWKIGKGVAGEDELSYDKKTLYVYPTPTSGEITLVNAPLGNYSIINEIGTVVYQFDVKELVNQTIQLTQFAKGVYFLRNNEGANVQEKIILLD